MPDTDLLLIHALAPPTRGGTAVVVHRLLREARVQVLTDRALRPEVEAGGELVLPARYRYFPKLGRGAGGGFRRELWTLLNLPLALVAGVQGALIARRAGVRSILSPLDGGFSQIAALVAARLSGVPRIAIVFDLWEENAYGPVARGLARLFERRVLRGARSVIVWGEETAEHYRRKHGVACDVLPIPIDAPDEAAEQPAGSGELLVAGAIYWAQEDAVRRLLRAAARVPEATTVILGNDADLRRRALEADRYEPALPGPEFQRRVARADALFLGLSFASAFPEVIRTATPARLPEYMASGRPILVHAPAGSHVAEYARREGFAEVVDEPDEEMLAQAVRRLLGDPGSAAERAARARSLALERHDAAAVVPRFLELAGL